MSRENDEDWYEACNPLNSTRGLVPVTYFEEVGKTDKQRVAKWNSIQEACTAGALYGWCVDKGTVKHAFGALVKGRIKSSVSCSVPLLTKYMGDLELEVY